MMENSWGIAAVWMGLALLASFISIRFNLSVALVEILVGIAAGKADADIVMENVEAAPAPGRFLHHRLDVALFGDVGLECDRLAAFRLDHSGGFLRRGQIAVHAQDRSSFAREGDGGGAAVAHAFAGALAGPDHDCRTIFQPHVVHSRLNVFGCGELIGSGGEGAIPAGQGWPSLAGVLVLRVMWGYFASKILLLKPTATWVSIERTCFRSPRPACGERSKFSRARISGEGGLAAYSLTGEFAVAGPSPQPSPR